MNVHQLRSILASLPSDAMVWVEDDEGAGQFSPNQHALLGNPVESIVFRRSPNPEWQRARDAARAQARAADVAKLRLEIEIQVRRELAAQLRAEASADLAADGEGQTT